MLVAKRTHARLSVISRLVTNNETAPGGAGRGGAALIRHRYAKHRLLARHTHAAVALARTTCVVCRDMLVFSFNSEVLDTSTLL